MRAVLLFVLLALSFDLHAARRAVLIGIDDYSASSLPRPSHVDADQERGWPDLQGAANDVEILRQMLVVAYGFHARDIVVLKNQQATRAAMLQAIERHLVQPARRGDTVFYYFAGHGSQVPNPASDEPDHLDESIVPADSRWGAEDIRDKELRPLFNRILDRGARLTLVLDHCHSGSGFRGLPTGARPRGIRRARAIADAKPYGPRPDERGALVLAATQDLDFSWETRGEDGRMHGAFTWAWIRALRDAAAGEPAEETFLRAQARLRAETPFQAPVMLGRGAARLRPFLGERVDRRGDRTVVAVERVDADGSVLVQGGWANGLAVDAQLQPLDVPSPRLRITQVLGAGRSVAHIDAARGAAPAIRSGALLAVVAWAAPQGRPLRVWAPRIAGDLPSMATFARRLAAASESRWLDDPAAAPAHLLRYRGGQWELLDRNGNATQFASDSAVLTAIARLHTPLFVQFPAPSALVDAIAIGQGIVAVDDPRRADYILTGRYAAQRLEYAWVRPLSDLPRRSTWTGDAKELRRDLFQLRRIHAWHTLESPAGSRAPYHLALQRDQTGELVRGGAVRGGEQYSIVLRASPLRPREVPRRYYYAFVIDSHGKSYLAYPPSGSVENRFPIAAPAPTEIRLGPPSAFRILPPYGTDTYFLLSTEGPLPNPAILAWDGVRAPAWRAQSQWSIEKVTFESVAP